MIARDQNDMDRLLELLAKEASSGITIDESAERDDLLSSNPEVDRDEILEIAAITQLAFLKNEHDDSLPMPDSLKTKIVERGRATVSAAAHDADKVVSIDSRRQDATPDHERRITTASYLGWAAAAALALTLVYDRVIMTGGVVAPDLRAELAEVRAAAGTIEVAWQAPESEGFERVTGQVVWNGDLQRGYMVLAGMPANQPDKSQYQLWIVDPSRDARPVDGGVFDIPEGRGELVVPINAKLDIQDPRAFAITEEQPGGVVVSEGPLLVVAPVTI